ncbi:GNAT family N-acetyltransferase [Metallumcola ferriviriculae]|uniref:GNAT family N-acetyltransferase n=1 Tax=Metallumcola ferriviriculae TaxID=3039180 RepID=A0AAU0UTL5_9FIRM|nr:GNAT family N-acetyltransferase [Desulfitibacteraceae bacterium MK1]
MTVTYREMSSLDVPEVSKLHNDLLLFLKNEIHDDYLSCIELETQDLSEKLNLFIENATKKIYIAVHKEKIVGFIAGEIMDCFLPISQKVGYLSGAFVLPGFRGMGIMKRLEYLLVSYFQDNGLKFVELNVLSRNLLGKRSWEKLGYEIFREQMRKKI